jgi:transposase InsO family protein
VQNAYIESFNGRFRDECLNESWFTTLADARGTIEAWRLDYNTQRPHQLARRFARRTSSSSSSPTGHPS